MFIGLACIKEQEYKIELRNGVSPICDLWRRRSPKKEQLERE